MSSLDRLRQRPDIARLREQLASHKPVEANLPVAAHIEVGSGIAAAPTPSGNTLTYEQYLSFMALNYLYHVMNMIAEGVFERMPSLKFVWADGAGPPGVAP